MKRLIVDLPAIRRSQIKLKTHTKIQTNASTERSRRFRDKLKGDSENLKKMKDRKEEENQSVNKK